MANVFLRCNFEEKGFEVVISNANVQIEGECVIKETLHIPFTVQNQELIEAYLDKDYLLCLLKKLIANL